MNVRRFGIGLVVTAALTVTAACGSGDSGGSGDGGDDSYSIGIVKFASSDQTSEQAIASMQQLADTVCRTDIGLSYEIEVLKFLRHELSAAERQSDVHEDLGDAAPESDAK